MNAVQRRAGFDAQLGQQDVAYATVRVEGGRPVAVAVQRGQQLGPEAFAQRVFPYEGRQLRDERGVAAESQVELDSSVYDGQSVLLEPDRLARAFSQATRTAGEIDPTVTLPPLPGANG